MPKAQIQNIHCKTIVLKLWHGHEHMFNPRFLPLTDNSSKIAFTGSQVF